MKDWKGIFEKELTEILFLTYSAAFLQTLLKRIKSKGLSTASNTRHNKAS